MCIVIGWVIVVGPGEWWLLGYPLVSLPGDVADLLPTLYNWLITGYGYRKVMYTLPHTKCYVLLCADFCYRLSPMFGLFANWLIVGMNSLKKTLSKADMISQFTH